MSVILAQVPVPPGVGRMECVPPHPESSPPIIPDAPAAAPSFISSRRVICAGPHRRLMSSPVLDAHSRAGSHRGGSNPVVHNQRNGAPLEPRKLVAAGRTRGRIRRSERSSTTPRRALAGHTARRSSCAKQAAGEASSRTSKKPAPGHQSGAATPKPVATGKRLPFPAPPRRSNWFIRCPSIAPSCSPAPSPSISKLINHGRNQPPQAAASRAQVERPRRRPTWLARWHPVRDAPRRHLRRRGPGRAAPARAHRARVYRSPHRGGAALGDVHSAAALESFSPSSIASPSPCRTWRASRNE